MATSKLSSAIVPIAGLLSLSVMAGCHHGETRAQDFTDNGAPTNFSRINDAQAAKGAAVDATLYPQHFNGNMLNALGANKLDLIVRGTSADQTIVVYLDMPKDSATARQTAVADYLKDAGIDEAGTQIVQGPNTTMNTATAYNLSEVYKADGNTFTGEAADATAAAASGTGSASSTTAK